MILEFLSFWRDCLVKGLSLGEGLLGIVEFACIFAWLLTRGKKAKQGKHFEEKANKMARYLFAGCFCLGTFVIAPFQINQESKQQVAKAEKAAFRAELYDNVSIERELGQEGITDVVFFVYVVNGGQPSVAMNWKCTATLPDKKVLTADARVESASVYMATQKLMLEGNQYLPLILSENPIGLGSAKKGWVVFRFGNNDYERLIQEGVEFSVEFQDSKQFITRVPWIVTKKYAMAKKKADLLRAK